MNETGGTPHHFSYWKKRYADVAAMAHMRRSGMAFAMDASHQRTGPSMYSVCLVNDADTPSEFIEFVLRGYFHKADTEAKDIARTLTEGGEVICLTATRDIAETKTEQVMDFLHENPYPIECVMKEC